jgi:hypothetical protein
MALDEIKELQKALKGGLGGKTNISTVTPVITAAAFGANDIVGGLIQFPDVVRTNKTGIIQSCLFIDDDLQTSDLELWLFDRVITAAVENEPVDFTDADMANCLGVIATADGTTYATSLNEINVVKNIGLVVKPNAGTTLFGQLVTRGTPTYTAAGLTIKLGILQD